MLRSLSLSVSGSLCLCLSLTLLLLCACVLYKQSTYLLLSGVAFIAFLLLVQASQVNFLAIYS